jgi:hypothetical protein
MVKSSLYHPESWDERVHFRVRNNVFYLFSYLGYIFMNNLLAEKESPI